jgi:hypothetical protein
MSFTYDFFAINTIAPNLETGPWIAGGAAMKWFLGENVGRKTNYEDFSSLHDIDVFCANNEQLVQVRERLIKTNVCTERPYVTDNAETYKFKSYNDTQWKIQLVVCKFFDSAESLLDAFDFVCCGIATDGNKYIMLPNAASDLNNKILNINRYNPTTVLARTLKYWSMGFTPSLELVEKISSDTTVETKLDGKGGNYDHSF